MSLFRSISCTNTTKLEAAVFLKQAWPQIYTIIKYDGGVRGLTGELLNYYCAFQWVFMDIFLVAITICLSTRLHQLNEHLKQYNGMVNKICTATVFLKIMICKLNYNSSTFHVDTEMHFECQKMPSSFWCTQRQCFTSLTKLIAKVDTKLAIVTVSSMTSNLYFILIQLLHSFE